MENIDINQIANAIAEKVSDSLDLRIAFIGLIGAIIGAAIPVIGNWLIHKSQTKPKEKLDEQRKDILKSILSEQERAWVKVETLANVIGASKEETQRLLIQIKARGSKTGSESWALMSRKPLPQIEQDEKQND